MPNSGIIDRDGVLSGKDLNELTGIPFELHSSSLRNEFYTLSPWLKAKSGYEVVATNPIVNEAELIKKEFANYRILYQVTPNSSKSFQQKVYTLAGIHRFAEDIVVDGHGSYFMTHTETLKTQTIALPNFYQVELLTSGGSKEICKSCQSFTFNPNELTNLFKITKPVTPPTPLTKGFFRVGAGGYIALDESSYCFLESGEHMRKCGYTQADYDRNFQVKILPEYLDKGLCSCQATPAPTPPPPPTTTPPPQTSKLPKGFFRSGAGGYVGVDDYSYCFLESGEHMRRCGYTQNDYDRNLQVALNTDHRSRGLCVCGPKSLFKWEWSPGQYGAAISKDGESFCSIGGIDHLNQCGYQASQYGPAPIFDVHKSKMEFKNSCNCP